MHLTGSVRPVCPLQIQLISGSILVRRRLRRVSNGYIPYILHKNQSFNHCKPRASHFRRPYSHFLSSNYLVVCLGFVSMMGLMEELMEVTTQGSALPYRASQQCILRTPILILCSNICKVTQPCTAMQPIVIHAAS